MRALPSAALVVATGLALAACSSKGGVGIEDDAGPGFDSGFDAGMDAGARLDASTIEEAGPNLDALFYMDPPPRLCLPDGGAVEPPPIPGGTPECPDDKNREGCFCENVGETAPCWPGLRVDRNRGVCHDGMTTCEPWTEFGGRWGPCMGYRLPIEGARSGPGACDCFSEGRWQIDNLAPCLISFGSMSYAVSTWVDAEGHVQCPRMTPVIPPIPPEPGTKWSENRLRVDCAGQFHLCYTLKAGDADAPAEGDCTLAEVCVDTWYPGGNVVQNLDPLPAWMMSGTACATRFANEGGYGEMSVIGESIACDVVDDGLGSRYVFNRVKYCPRHCAPPGSDAGVGEPDGGVDPACLDCMLGGSGTFGSTTVMDLDAGL